MRKPPSTGPTAGAVTTVKPSGTISKLFGLTEGAHLPARAQYLRWVQFKGTRDPETGDWTPNSDPLLADYAARGYPLRALQSFPGMTIVGFPTVPLIMRLGLADRLVTAPEATPAQQYHWLRLLERHWIGADQGNQVSYTLKLFTDRHDLDGFRTIIRDEQPGVLFIPYRAGQIAALRNSISAWMRLAIFETMNRDEIPPAATGDCGSSSMNSTPWGRSTDSRMRWLACENLTAAPCWACSAATSVRPWWTPCAGAPSGSPRRA